MTAGALGVLVISVPNNLRLMLSYLRWSYGQESLLVPLTAESFFASINVARKNLNQSGSA